MSDEIDLYINEDGSIEGVYSDDLAELFADEATETRRASHVEPHPTAGYGWYADMIPCRGPVLGANDTSIYQWEFAITDKPDALWAGLQPFATRAEALAAERAWLDARMDQGAL